MRAPVLPLLSPVLLAILGVASVGRAAGPTPRQCVAANEASVKLVDEQKLRAARQQLLACASPSCPKEVRAECTHQIDEINAHLPTIVFSVKTAAGQDVAAVTVTMDGELVTDRLDGTAIPLDPGSHELTFTVAGERPVRRMFVFHDGDKQRREAVVVGSPVAPPASAPGEGERPDDQGHTQRVVGVVGVVAGGVGLAVGAILGSFASSAWSTAKAACPAETACSPAAVHDSQQVTTYATASTVGFIAGGVLVAGGITVFLLAPRHTTAKLGLRVSPRELLLRGTF